MILAIDLDGAVLKHRPFRVAHKKWFDVFSCLLEDDAVKNFDTSTDYFTDVKKVMNRFLPDVSLDIQILFARNMFGMLTLAQVKKSDIIIDFVSYLSSLKKKYRLALITTTPQSAINPILERLGLDDIFDFIYASPMSSTPDKKMMFTYFIHKYGKPAFYIGDGDEHITLAKECNIPTISVNWVSKAKIKGDHDVKTVEELKKIVR